MRISDWSSDVCSSDLPVLGGQEADAGGRRGAEIGAVDDHVDRYVTGRQWRHLDDVVRRFVAREDVVADDRDQIRCAIRARDRGLPGRLGALLECHVRSEEHTSELQSLMRISYAVF